MYLPEGQDGLELCRHVRTHGLLVSTGPARAEPVLLAVPLHRHVAHTYLFQSLSPPAPPSQQCYRYPLQGQTVHQGTSTAVAAHTHTADTVNSHSSCPVHPYLLPLHSMPLPTHTPHTGSCKVHISAESQYVELLTFNLSFTARTVRCSSHRTSPATPTWWEE